MQSHSIIENVVKQGYLKKGNYGASRLSGFFRRNEVNKWFVFTIRQGIPYLEYYDTDVDVFTQQPINSFNLSTCQNVKSMGNSNPPSFCIVCPERVIELVASSRTQMVEWVNEVEASLTRLGILKNEVIEHVYTVCPAVVCKPRVSKEVSSEKEAEPSTVTTSINAASDVRSLTDVSTAHLPIGSAEYNPSQRTPPLRQRPSTSKSSRSSFAGLSSSSFHGSSDTGQETPPPLPIRSFSYSLRITGQQETPEPEVPAAKPQPAIHAVIESSNDSDFVSPEIIAELRQQHQDQKKAGNLIFLDRNSGTKSRISPVIPNDAIDNVSRDIFEFTSDERNSLLQAPLEPIKISEVTEAKTSCHSDIEHTELPLFLQDDTFIGVIDTREEVIENVYSDFPCQGSSETDVSIADINYTSSSVISKPTPVTRKVIAKVYSSLDGVSESKSVLSEHKTLFSVGDNETIKCDNVYNNIQKNDNISVVFDKCDNQSTEGKQQVLHDDYTEMKQQVLHGDNTQMKLQVLHGDSTEMKQQVLHGDNTQMKQQVLHGDNTEMKQQVLHGDNTEMKQQVLHGKNAEEKQQGLHGDNLTIKERDKDSGSTSETNQAELKIAELSPSKDENENFYGLIYDDGPPTSMAPPPPIPPLPPRHNSLKVRCEVNKTTTQEHQAISSCIDVNSQSSSTLPLSAFSAAASGKHRGLPLSSEHSAVPPLLPSKSGSKRDSSRKSNQTSAFVKSSSVDIPPRQTSHNSSVTKQDQPPAIPSRNSQSFIIKRPQITALSVKSSTDETSAQKSSTADNHLSNDNKHQETGVPKGASNLSRRMLIDRAHSLHTVVSLKQTQAEILQTEISMPSVAVTITEKAGHGIALVDWNSFPCVVGWNQKDFPSLHGKLHLGDLIFSINSIAVTSSDSALKLIKQSSSSRIEVILHRMPYAKVFAIHRNTEGQSLGIKRDGGTGEIIYVDPNGLSAQHGLTNHAQSALGNGRCNWFLTEINNRPLNLFFKDNEIDHRLVAVGREISLVVQPSDFIHEIRRQFKKLKNYKNFITQ